MPLITPHDIQKNEFIKSFRGYDTKQVDSFLNKIAADYGDIYAENIKLKEQLENAQESLSKYKELEENLQKTLVLAQKNSEDLLTNAKKEANVIIKEAEQTAAREKQKSALEADKIIKEAENKVRDILEEYRHLERQALAFKSNFKTFLLVQLDGLETLQVEEETDDIDDIDDTGRIKIPKEYKVAE